MRVLAASTREPTAPEPSVLPATAAALLTARKEPSSGPIPAAKGPILSRAGTAPAHKGSLVSGAPFMAAIPSRASPRPERSVPTGGPARRTGGCQPPLHVSCAGAREITFGGAFGRPSGRRTDGSRLTKTGCASTASMSEPAKRLPPEGRSTWDVLSSRRLTYPTLPTRTYLVGATRTTAEPAPPEGGLGKSWPSTPSSRYATTGTASLTSASRVIFHQSMKSSIIKSN